VAEPGRGFSVMALVGIMALAGGGGLAVSTRSGSGGSPKQPEGSRQRPPAPEPKRQESASKPPARRDVYSMLERFAGMASPELPVEDGAARTRRAIDQLRLLGYTKLQPLIATVPDPEDSRFANLFDDLISAARVALERSGFVDDRFQDPWRVGAGTGEEGKPLRREQPGALFFRRMSPQGGEVVMLLLVGERPAGGVQRRAFEASLDLAAAILAAQPSFGAAAAPTLPILGPALSGTTESIRLGMLRWLTKRQSGPDVGAPFDLQIISGAASNDDNQSILGDQLTAQVRALYPSGTRPFTSTFHATVHPNSAQHQFVVDYLVNRVGACRIGLLSESSTSYGGQFARVPGTATCGGAAVRLIDLPFPLHISKLRSEYDKNQEDGADEKPALGQRRFQRLEREDTTDIDEDAFPAKSRVTQSVSEIALEQTLRAISTEDVRAIVIAASSTADILFLVEKVRQSFPNVTIVLNESELMYLHEDVPFMEGVLVASTYPLLPWAQRLTFPFEGEGIRLLFPSTLAQGTYNATLFLLGPLTHVNVLDYGSPFALPTDGLELRPSLWMTVVSRGEFWPVVVSSGAVQPYLQAAHADELEIKKRKDDIAKTLWTVPSSYVFRLAAFLLAFADLLLAYAYVRGLLERRLPRRRPMGTLSGLFRKRPEGPLIGLFVPPRGEIDHLGMYRFEVASLFFLAFVVSAGFLAVEIVTVSPAPAVIGRFERELTVAFGAVTFLVLALMFHALYRWMCHVWDDRRPRERVAVPFALTCALGASLAIYCLTFASRFAALRAGGAAGPSVAHLMFFIERARNLDNGVSLLWEGLLLGVAHALWTLGHIRQVRIIDDAADLRRYGVIPTRQVGAAELRSTSADGSWLGSLDLAKPMRAVVREVEGVWPSKSAILLMGIVLLDAIWISHLLPFLEPIQWGWLCTLAYGCLLALSVYGCTRYLRAWRALADVLARVAPRPVTVALGRIPAELLTSFRRPWDRQVFEVWQQHCRAVFDRIRRDPKLVPRSSAALGVREKDLLHLLKDPVALQIEEAERASAPEGLGGQEAVRLWEEFLAMRLVAFIQYIRTHLSNLVAVSTAALLPAFWATNFYPLRDSRFMLMLVIVVATATTSIAAYVFIQMNRNYVLSKIEHTNPGHVTWDSAFVTSLLVHVALPLFAVLAVKFPELGRAWTAVMSALSVSRSAGG
jgi:hypothetical protein